MTCRRNVEYTLQDLVWSYVLCASPAMPARWGILNIILAPWPTHHPHPHPWINKKSLNATGQYIPGGSNGMRRQKFDQECYCDPQEGRPCQYEQADCFF